MARARRQFTREFKLEVCRRLAAGEVSLAQVSREHDLTRSVLERWRERYRTHGEDAFSKAAGTEDQALREAQRRIAELEASLGRAHLEVEFMQRLVALQGTRPRSGTP